MATRRRKSQRLANAFLVVPAIQIVARLAEELSFSEILQLPFSEFRRIVRTLLSDAIRFLSLYWELAPSQLDGLALSIFSLTLAARCILSGNTHYIESSLRLYRTRGKAGRFSLYFSLTIRLLSTYLVVFVLGTHSGTSTGSDLVSTLAIMAGMAPFAALGVHLLLSKSMWEPLKDAQTGQRFGRAEAIGFVGILLGFVAAYHLLNHFSFLDWAPESDRRVFAFSMTATVLLLAPKLVQSIFRRSSDPITPFMFFVFSQACLLFFLAQTKLTLGGSVGYGAGFVMLIGVCFCFLFAVNWIALRGVLLWVAAILIVDRILCHLEAVFVYLRNVVDAA